MKAEFMLKIATAISLIGSAPVFAGTVMGGIVYGPVESVPSLSGGMLIVLALLLTAVGYRMFKQQTGGGTMASVLVAAAVVVSGVSGVKLVSDAYADFSEILMSENGGGTVEFPLENGGALVRNDTDREQFIRDIFPEACAFSKKIEMVNSAAKNGDVNALMDYPICQIGDLVPKGAACEVLCFFEV